MDVFQVEYTTLNVIASTFFTNCYDVAQMLNHIRSCIDNLDGEWIGDGSDAFFAEMSELFLPSMVRLINALEESSQSTQQMISLSRAAEQEACALFETIAA